MGTPKENTKDAVERDCTLPRGGKHPSAKISEQLAKDIFYSQSEKLTHKDRAKMFGVSIGIVQSIDSGKNWKHLFSDEDFSKRKSKKISHNKSIYERIDKCHIDKMTEKECAKLLELNIEIVKKRYSKLNGVKAKIPKPGKKWFETKISEDDKRKYIEKIKSNCELLDDKDGGHWMCSSHINEDGYSKISFKSKMVRTHRLSKNRKLFGTNVVKDLVSIQIILKLALTKIIVWIR
jgi:hypothetical protein